MLALEGYYLSPGPPIGWDCEQPAREAPQAVRQDRGRLEGQGRQPHPGARALPG